MTRWKRILGWVGATALLVAIATLWIGATPAAAVDCARRYVAGGDGVVVGTGVSSSDRYSDKLMSDHLTPSPGPWCLYNTAADPTKTSTYMSDGQQSTAWNLKPVRLITLQVGRQNDVIVDHVTKCLQNIKDHDFADATACASAILANTGAWSTLTSELSQILNTYKIQMSGNPGIVIAVVGYFNPYQTDLVSVAADITSLCTGLVDTIPTCTARWVLLPPALTALDQVVQMLNTTIKNVVSKFTWASQGRFVFVNPYDKFKSHCAKMDVEIKTTVFHPPFTIHQHDKQVDFGCSTPWIVDDGSAGTKNPFPYLTPATSGILIAASQTTSGLGINPNADGHDCISDLIWEAVKIKLGVPEAPATPCS